MGRTAMNAAGKPARKPSGNRMARTRERKQEILDAALECFSSIGYDQTTIEDIRAKAGASIGSIYHHFGAKDRIAAALYLRGVRETQDAGLEALLAADSAESGIAAQVAAYASGEPQRRMSAFIARRQA